MRTPVVEARFLGTFVGQVPPGLESQLIVTDHGIGLKRGAVVMGGFCGLFGCSEETFQLSVRAYYLIPADQWPADSGAYSWSSTPALPSRGELLAVCPDWPVFPDDWPSVVCTARATPTVYQLPGMIPVDGSSSTASEQTLLDTRGSLLRREYLPPSLTSGTLSFQAGSKAAYAITIDVAIETKLKNGYLYFSSRCDSEGFAFEFPPDYRIEGYPHPE